MRGIGRLLLLLGVAAGLFSPPPAEAWPGPAYPEIFAEAQQTLPSPLRQLLADMEPVLHEDCGMMSLEEATRRAIDQFARPEGGVQAAVAAMRDAGCAAAAINDPDLDALVESYRERFSVVFYGWHPALQARDFAGYVAARTSEVEALETRFRESAALPNRSDMVELSPEFGLASLAYSHAVTDVANVWLFIWTAVNGSY